MVLVETEGCGVRGDRRVVVLGETEGCGVRGDRGLWC